MEVLFEKSYLHIALDKTLGALIITWKGFTPSLEFRTGIDTIVDLMKQHRITKTLTDLVEHRVIGTEDQEYAARRSLEFSANHWAVKRAIITPKDVFARFSVKQVNQKVARDEAQDRQLFLTYEDARAWLME